MGLGLQTTKELLIRAEKGESLSCEPGNELHFAFIQVVFSRTLHRARAVLMLGGKQSSYGG